MRDALCRSQDSLSGGVSQSEDLIRSDLSQYREETWKACVHLGSRRSTIIGWPTCDDIVNECSTAIDSVVSENDIQKLSRGPREGSTFRSFAKARCFSQDNKGRVTWTLTRTVTSLLEERARFTQRLRVLSLDTFCLHRGGRSSTRLYHLRVRSVVGTHEGSSPGGRIRDPAQSR
jgi:hypothetical protein